MAAASHLQAEAHEVQQEAHELLAQALEVLKSNCESAAMQPGQAEFQTVTAVMALMALQLAKSNNAIRHLEEASAQAESFNALVAATLVNQSQQIHELTKLQAASLGPVPPTLDASLLHPVAQQQPAHPLLSPQLIRPAHEARQQLETQQQPQQMRQQVNHKLAASRPRESQNAAALPSRTIAKAVGELHSLLPFLCSSCDATAFLKCPQTLQGIATSCPLLVGCPALLDQQVGCSTGCDPPAHVFASV